MANSSENAKQIGRNITNLLIEKEKTQQELADKMGYTNRSSIAKVENGAVDLSQSKIIQFAKVLETTPGELMGEVLPDGQPTEYYDNEIVQAVTDRLRTNPEYGVLFKASANLKPEDVELVTKFIEKMS